MPPTPRTWKSRLSPHLCWLAVLALTTSACGIDELHSTQSDASRRPPPATLDPEVPTDPADPSSDPRPVFHFAATNVASSPEADRGLPAHRVSFEVLLERDGYEGDLAVTVELCADALACSAVYGRDFLLDTAFGSTAPWRTTLTFAAGSDRQSFDVFVQDDAVHDGDRALSMVLRDPSAPATLGAAAQTLRLLDDDPQGPVFTFAASGTTTVLESSLATAGTMATARVHLERHGYSENLQVVATVCAAGSGCTAAPGVDFGPVFQGLYFQQLYFANGATDLELSIPVFDNELIDGTRRLVLTLSAPTAPATIEGEPWALTLVDDEQDLGPVFRFAASNPSDINEAFAAGVPNRPLGFVVELDRRGDGGGHAVEVEVCAAASGCTAIGGLDYQLDGSFAPRATLLFPTGVWRATFNVHIVDDPTRDGTHELTLRLRNASASARIAGGVRKLAIIDDETPLSAPGYSFRYTRNPAPESAGDGVAAVIVDRHGSDEQLAQSGLVEVSVEGTGTTAVEGLDFSANDLRTPLMGSPRSATLVFPAGVRARRFVLHTLADQLADGDKQLSLVLGGAQGSPLGDVTSTLLRLVDREALTVGLDGAVIARLDFADIGFPQGNRCDTNRSPAGNVGPCGASPVSPSSCSEGMADAITSAWLLDLDPHELAGNALHIPLQAQHVLSFRFRTPPVGTPAMYSFATDEPAPAVGPPVKTFTSISAARCDFDRTKLEARDPCFQSGFPNARWAITGTAAEPSTSPHCVLQPDAEYYFNLRMENAEGVGGRDECLAMVQAGVISSEVCGVLVAMFGYDL